MRSKANENRGMFLRGTVCTKKGHVTHAMNTGNIDLTQTRSKIRI